MPNLIEELGPQYFQEFFTGALFLRGDELLQVEGAGSTRINARNVETGAGTYVPADFFTGYKAFEYPVLGYRKLTPQKVGYITRQQSTARGVRASTLSLGLSPASSLLRDLGAYDGESGVDNEKLKIIKAFKPAFDSLNDLPRLLDGSELALVLSPNMLIEPSVDNAQDHFAIYYKQSLIGKMNARGAVTWTSPAFASLIPELG